MAGADAVAQRMMGPRGFRWFAFHGHVRAPIVVLHQRLFDAADGAYAGERNDTFFKAAKKIEAALIAVTVQLRGNREL